MALEFPLASIDHYTNAGLASHRTRSSVSRCIPLIGSVAECADVWRRRTAAAATRDAPDAVVVARCNAPSAPSDLWRPPAATCTATSGIGEGARGSGPQRVGRATMADPDAARAPDVAAPTGAAPEPPPVILVEEVATPAVAPSAASDAAAAAVTAPVATEAAARPTQLPAPPSRQPPAPPKDDAGAANSASTLGLAIAGTASAASASMAAALQANAAAVAAEQNLWPCVTCTCCPCAL